MKPTTASSIRILAKQVPSVLDKNIAHILEQVKNTVIVDNRKTICNIDMSGSTLEDIRLIVTRLIELGFEVEHQYYSLLVSWETPESTSQVGDKVMNKVMNKAEFDNSITSMKKAVRVAWDLCEDPSNFVAVVLETIKEELTTCNGDVAKTQVLSDLRRRLNDYFEWYA